VQSKQSSSMRKKRTDLGTGVSVGVVADPVGHDKKEEPKGQPRPDSVVRVRRQEI
jgi:hypothetical protein